MRHAREPRSIIKAAEQAAAAGDYAYAERLLRDAARLQEDRLGSLHPDLANTLNNLGVVCEITSKPADAEQYFRRAYAIAIASLGPHDPFVITSRKNLSDFCEARGKPVDLPTAAPKAPTVSESNGDPAPEDPEITSRKFFTRLALGGLGPIAMLMIILAAGLPRLGSRELAAPSSVTAFDSQQTVAPPQAPVEVEPATTPQEATTVAARDADDTSASAIAPARPVTQASTTVRLTVVRASLCAELDDWSCDPADRPVPPGPLFFYTQIKSTSATTIQHRWYREDRLQQSVELRVQATRTGGYRTYSRNLMKSESAGSWRVEVRSEDGALLHEERFTVR
jgi:hypothetical protein